MYIKTAAEISVAIFAVFGLYALLRIFVAARFLPVHAGLILHIGADTKPCDVPALLEKVREDRFFFSHARVIALVERGACEDVIAALEQCGAAYYFIV